MININYTTFSVVEIITIFSLILNLLFAIPTLLTKIKSLTRRKALKRLLEFDEVIIHIPSRKIDRPKPVVAMEDYAAYENIRNVLEYNAFCVSLKYIPTSGDIELEQDKANIIICGPKNSPLIKETFQRMNGLSFVEEEGIWYFLDEETNNKIYSPMDQNPPKNSDLAFLGKLSIHSKPNQSVLLICGIHAMGSLGIASFLNNKDMLDTLLKKAKSKRFYSIIYSAYSEEYKQIYNLSIFFEPKEML